MPEILVEFIPDFTKLETGVDKLVSEGTISKEIGALFVDAGKSIDQFSTKFSVGLSKIPKDMADAVNRGLKPATDQAKKNIESLSKSGIKDLGELKKRVEGITDSFTKGFSEGVEQSLKDAGFSMEEFNKAIKLAQNSSEGLKTELLEITKQLQVLKLNGEENSQQYSELAQKAILYRKAIQDVSEQINKQASDTRNLDTAIEFVTGLASAFSILQGVQALAGEENKDFQKTLVRVQAAMSILVGLQQLQNILKKESNLIQAVENTQKKLSVVITSLDSAAQSKNIIVKGAATIAQKALNAAMEANPAFILIAAFTALAGAIAFFSKNTDDAKDIQEDFNSELERTQTIIDDQIDTIKQNTDLQIAQAKARGASEKEVSDLTLDLIAKENKVRQDAFDLRVKQTQDVFKKLTDASKGFAITGRIANDLGITEEQVRRFATTGITDLNEVKDILDRIRAVRVSDVWKGFSQNAKDANKAAEDAFVGILDAGKKLNQTNIDAAKETAAQLQRDREEAARKQKEADQKAKEAREKRLKEEADARRRDLEDELAVQKSKLLLTKADTVGELEAKKEVLRAELAIALDNDKLTFNQRRLLLQQFFKDQRTLTEQFNESNRKKVVEDQISNIKAQLNAIQLSGEERLKLTIEQLEIEKEEELRLVKNNESKRLEIISKFDKEIFDLRKKARQDAFQEELEETRRNLAQRKALLEANADDEKLPFEKRKAAIQELSGFEFSEFTKRRLENQRELKNREIDEKEFSKKAKEIDNDEAEAKRKSEEKITGIVKDETGKRLKYLQDTVAAVADFANQAIGALKGFLDTIAANENNRIAAQKDSLERLRENGIISQKEYEARLKVIDRLDKQTKQKQAEREKSIALFEAFVNGAAAIIKAAPNVPLIVATSILVAAQIAAIAARQIPKFGKGTKSAPKGLAEVGETGTELVQMGDKYFVASHPQVVWFKGGEKVYNPTETKQIFNKEKSFYNSNIEMITREVIQSPQANMSIVNNSNGHSKDLQIDYDKMAKKFGDEIAKHPRLINNIDANGYSQYIIEGLNKSKYLNNRFRF